MAYSGEWLWKAVRKCSTPSSESLCVSHGAVWSIGRWRCTRQVSDGQGASETGNQVTNKTNKENANELSRIHSLNNIKEKSWSVDRPWHSGRGRSEFGCGTGNVDTLLYYDLSSVPCLKRFVLLWVPPAQRPSRYSAHVSIINNLGLETAYLCKNC